MIGHRNTAYPVNDPYCIYVIREVGNDHLAKVGVARTPKYRVSSMQAGNPRPIEIAWQITVRGRERAHKIEFAAHKLLSDKHVRGEWFAASVEEATDAIERARGQIL